MTNKKIGLLAAVALTAFVQPLYAQAVTTSQNMQVNLTVTSQCILSPITAVSLSGSLLSGNLDGAGNLSVQCTQGTAYKVRMGLGTGTGASLTQRRMTTTAAGGTATVNYNIFTDSARTLVWGDQSTSPNLINGTGTGAAVSVPVYIRVPAQNAATGTYSDTVAVTVEY